MIDIFRKDFQSANCYCILCDSQVSTCPLIDDMLDSSLNQLYHIYDMSYSHRIIGTITISVPYITVKFLDLSMLLIQNSLFLNNI